LRVLSGPRVLAAAIALHLVLAGTAQADRPPVDHFVLALSWSPSFCATPDAADEVLQCGNGSRFAFIVHGLWPQYRKGSAENCPTTQRWIPEEQIAEMLPIMPSKSLIIHQWRKHGTCSALSPRNYFALTRDLYEKIRIPALFLTPDAPLTTTRREIISEFLHANPGLQPGMIEVACTRGRRARLTELRICFTRAGRFTQCRPRRRSDCRSETLVLPPVNGHKP
jgi:ribonuclease T2